ncbi:hypothetical protein K2Q16_04370 [Patescibacteria group bacterium]|nr:hypothetical protein [Patescibacteria group bacterium]
MNSKLIVGVVAVLGIASGIFFWQLGRTSVPVVPDGLSPSLPADSLNRQPGANDPISGRAAMTTLLALGRDFECRIQDNSDAVASGSVDETEGTIFISGGALRGDFLVPRESGAEPVVSSMIVKDGTMFLWSVIDGEAWGMKSSVTQDSGTTSPQLETQEPVSLNDDIAYDCTPWVGVDRSVFVPPSDVLFRDLSTIMEGGMEYGTTFEGAVVPGGGDACAACVLISDSADKAACAERFSCTEEVR